MSKRLILADDHKMFREGLRSLIESHLGHKVVGEADNGKTAIELVKKHQPDLVIMDLSMPVINGIEATKRIRQDFPKMKIIALSMYSDKRFVADMFTAGASAYLLKDCAFDELEQAIQDIQLGKTFVSPSLHPILLDDYVRKLQGQYVFDKMRLTPKERHVLTLLAEGKTTKEIASELDVTTKTVDTHRSHLMDKLGMQTSADLVKYAISQGLVKPPE
jgi:two-component system response regulator NreC